jgi:hypothetical protein
LSLHEERHDGLHATIDELLDGRALDTVDGTILSQLIVGLKDRKQSSIMGGDYHQSQMLENLIQEVNTKYSETTYHSVQNSRLTNLRVQLLKAKEDLDAAEEFWRQAKEQHDTEYATSLAALEKQHTQQLEDFDTSFPEILPTNFRKLSPQLLQLREQERHLVLSKRYEDAIPYRERAELETQRQKFMTAFQTQRQQLIDSQNGQRECFEKNWVRKLERFECEKEHEMLVLNRTIANFETKIAMWLSMERGRLRVGSRGRPSSRGQPRGHRPRRSTPA